MIVFATLLIRRGSLAHRIGAAHRPVIELADDLVARHLGVGLDSRALARSLRAERRNGRPTILREIADRLAQANHRASTGKPYAPSVVARMLRRAS
jgi:hypothetical protein